jgi:16S rRNA (guanine966-N2)-methyltransferase
MRVIAGTAKGTELRGPKTAATRPMTDRVKEALFSHLGDRLAKARVLDLFAGSGSLSIEALSRGASGAVLVESSKPAVEAAKTNLRRCGFLDRATLLRSDVRRFLSRSKPNAAFDIVFVDPPYAMDDEEVARLLVALVPHLGPSAAVCLHREKARLGEGRYPREDATGGPSSRESTLLPWPECYRVVFERSYGGAVVGVAELARKGQRG